MLKFNNFPPQKPGDVELGSSAIRYLNEVADDKNLSLELRRAKLEGIGEAVGRTVAASVEMPNRKAVLNLTIPISETVGDLTSPASYTPFQTGLLHGVFEEVRAANEIYWGESNE